MDLEKCYFRNFKCLVALTLTLHRVEVTQMCISDRGLPTYQIKMKLEKLFVDVQTYGQMCTCRHGVRKNSGGVTSR